MDNIVEMCGDEVFWANYGREIGLIELFVFLG